MKPKAFLILIARYALMVGTNLKNLLGLAGILLVVVAIVTVPRLIEQNAPEMCFADDGTCLHEEQSEFIIALIPVFIGVGAIFGAFALYLLYEKGQPSKKQDASLALSLMEKDERKVVGRIVEEGGRITQSEVSRIEGIGKVKAHRILERLEKRGVLEREQYGKTNMIKLSGKYRKLFLKD